MIGQTIANYRILEKLGQGGMGVVYLAEDIRLQRRVALKVLPREFAQDAQRRSRFQHEARAAAAFSHPGIAAVYEFEEQQGELYIVFEFIQGQNLRRLIQAGAPALEEVLDIAADLARALDAAHTRGIVHRDLKPENVMRTLDGDTKILDFGLARFPPTALDGETQSFTDAGSIVGTISYMAPEQLEGKDVDFRADLFAFGVLLYELATGQHPFEGASRASTISNVLTAEPAPLAQRRPQLPAELDRIVRKCLRKRRDERYQSTRDLLVDLQELKRASGERRSSAALAYESSDEAGSLIAGLRRWGAANPRRWWEINLLWVIGTYALFLLVGWEVRSFLPAGWGLRLFLGLVAFVVVPLTLRLMLFNTALFNPADLPEQVRRLSPWVRGISVSHLGLLMLMGGLIFEQHNFWGALLLGLGVAGLLLVFFYEPMIDRAAFGVMRSESGEHRARRAAMQRLAASQLAYAIVLFVPVGAGKLSVEEFMGFNGGALTWTRLAMLGYGLTAMVGGAALAVNATETARGNAEMVRSFRRFFAAFLLMELAGVGAWLWGALEAPAVVYVLVTVMLIALPFAQWRMTAEILRQSGDQASAAAG
jgi:predicted Ser/Thr protein kinase